MPITLAHRFSCTRCSHTATFLAPGGVLFFLVWLVVAVGVFASRRDEPDQQLGAIVFGGVASLVLLHGVYVRARNRSARS